MIALDGPFHEEGQLLGARLPYDDVVLQGVLTRALPGFGEQDASGSLMVSRPNHLPGLTVHVSPVGQGGC